MQLIGSYGNLYRKLRRFIGKAGLKFEKGYFFKMDLQTHKFELGDGSFEMKLAADISELQDIILERGPSFQLRYEKWLNSGYLCFCLFKNNAIIGVLWLHSSKYVDLTFGIKEKVNDTNTEAWVMDGYLLKRYRGIGVYRYFWHNVLQVGLNRGFKYVYAIVLNSNIKSLKVHYSLGLRDVYKVLYYYRILWFNIYWYKHFSKMKDLSMIKRGFNF